MTVRHRGLELAPGSPGHPALEIVREWMGEGTLGPVQAELLYQLRQAGYCFCETTYGCMACKGEHNMRNAFMMNEDSAIPPEVRPYLENGPYMLLPALDAGYSYKTVALPGGRVAIVVAKEGE